MTRFFSLRRNRAALRRLGRRFAGNRKGVALVEFAMVLPVMLTLYFGIVETTQGVMINRKVVQLNSSLADLTARVASVTAADIDNIFDAAQTVMLPFTQTAPRMAIASIVIDSAGIARVCWSSQRNSTVPARGTTVTLPTDLRVPNTSLIMARTSYDFQPVIGYLVTGSIRIGDNPIYLRPRVGQAGGTGNVEQVQRVGTAMCPGFS